MMKMSGRKWLPYLLGAYLMLTGPSIWAAPGAIPVILDTDIGGDIDDAWALGFLLKSPELDVKLVLGENGNALYRAMLLGKFLTDAGRTDIPIGVGIEAPGMEINLSGPQGSQIKDYDLKKYPGQVQADGVQALIDLIMSSPVPITVICIGPAVNIAEALRRQPEIAHKANFVGMFGSVRRGWGGSPKTVAEENVRSSVPSAKAALSAPWTKTITPLDTCGLVRLTGEDYQAVLNSSDPVAKAIIASYLSWSKDDPTKIQTKSTTLFDTVAVYLAFSHTGLKMEPLPIVVTNEGMTVIKEGGPMMSVATEWEDLEGFTHLLAQRLSGEKGKERSESHHPSGNQLK